MSNKKEDFVLDEDEWCLLSNALNIYMDLKDSMTERLGHDEVTWEREAHKRLIDGKFGQPDF